MRREIQLYVIRHGVAEERGDPGSPERVLAKQVFAVEIAKLVGDVLRFIPAALSRGQCTASAQVLNIPGKLLAQRSADRAGLVQLAA